MTLAAPYDFKSPFDPSEFAAWIIAADDAISAGMQHRLSMDLVRQGCRYAVCSGVICSSWDDSIDVAAIELEHDGLLPSNRLVMTTWHENESAEEISEFFVEWAQSDDFVPERWLVLGIGAASKVSVAQAMALTEARLASKRPP